MSPNRANVDSLPVFTKADVIGYEMQRGVLDQGFPDPREGMRIEPTYGEPYYSAIEVEAEVGQRIFPESEIIFEGQRSAIVGQTVHLDAGMLNRKPWRFQLRAIRPPHGDEGA